MNFELAKREDLPAILNIYSQAREYMKTHGNPTQWGDSWPEVRVLEEDISLSRLFLVKENEDILAVYALIEGEDPCYKDIEGKWLNDKEYITIHRLASSFKKKNIFHELISYLVSKYHLDIRIDTHQNNVSMIEACKKEGFVYTGVIYVNNSSEHSARIAFQLPQ